MKENSFAFFSGTSHPKLAGDICEILACKPSKLHISTFPDGETFCQVQENVRGKDTFLLQSLALNPNQYLMELFVLVDALKRASAKSIVAILPYYAYCRQDRKDQPRVPITAKLVADLLQKAGIDQVLTLDLHTSQVQGFFDAPLDNLQARVIFRDILSREISSDFVVVSPDIGSIKLARAYASDLQRDFAVVDKIRKSAEHTQAAQLMGSVEGRDILLVDDMCSTGGTLAMAAELCKEKGARHIYAVLTHALFVGPAFRNIAKSPIKKIWVSDSVARDFSKIYLNIETVSVAPLIAESVRCVLEGRSISSLFRPLRQAISI